MNPNYELTEQTVKVYRELYYQHFKPLSKLELSDREIRKQMLPFLEKYGWTFNQFMDYVSIDLMQRLVLEYAEQFNPPLKSKPDFIQYDPNYGALRLKDNQLSEDPDKFH